MKRAHVPRQESTPDAKRATAAVRAAFEAERTLMGGQDSPRARSPSLADSASPRRPHSVSSARFRPFIMLPTLYNVAEAGARPGGEPEMSRWGVT